MTKAELIAALSDVADDTEILIESWPGGMPAFQDDNLFAIDDVQHFEAEGSDGEYPAFVCIAAKVEYQAPEAEAKA